MCTFFGGEVLQNPIGFSQRNSGLQYLTKPLPTDMKFPMAGVGLRREVHRGLFSE